MLTVDASVDVARNLLFQLDPSNLTLTMVHNSQHSCLNSHCVEAGLREQIDFPAVVPASYDCVVCTCMDVSANVFQPFSSTSRADGKRCRRRIPTN